MSALIYSLNFNISKKKNFTLEERCAYNDTSWSNKCSKYSANTDSTGIGLDRPQNHHNISTVEFSFLDSSVKMISSFFSGCRNMLCRPSCLAETERRAGWGSSGHCIIPGPLPGSLWSPRGKSSSTKTQKMKQTHISNVGQPRAGPHSNYRQGGIFFPF